MENKLNLVAALRTNAESLSILYFSYVIGIRGLDLHSKAIQHPEYTGYY